MNDSLTRHTPLDSLTAVRGLAALMIVFYHARDAWHPIFASGERFTMLVATGWVWVHFFFILSGFVMMEAYASRFAVTVLPRGWLRFVFVRFGRIYPLHFVVLITMAMFATIGWTLVDDPPGSFTSSLLLTQGFTFVPMVWNVPAWSISTEFYVYLAFPWIVVLLHRVPHVVTWLLWIAAALAAASVFVPNPEPRPEWALGRLLTCMVEFALGCMTHRLFAGRSWWRSRSPQLVAAIVLFPIALLALPRLPFSGWLLPIAVVGFAITIGLLGASSTILDKPLGSRVLQWLGRISYSIYLVHSLLFGLAGRASSAWLGTRNGLHDVPSWIAIALFALYLTCLIGISWTTWRWIEEPFRHWSKAMAGGSRSMNEAR